MSSSEVIYNKGINFAKQFQGAKFLYPIQRSGCCYLKFRCTKGHEFEVYYPDIVTGMRKDFCLVCPAKEREEKNVRYEQVRSKPVYILQKKIDRFPFRNIETIEIDEDTNAMKIKDQMIKKLINDVKVSENININKRDHFRIENEALSNKGTVIHGKHRRVEYRMITIQENFEQRRPENKFV